MLLEREKALVELKPRIRSYQEREGETRESFGLGVPSGDVILFELFFLFYEGHKRNLT